MVDTLIVRLSEDWWAGDAQFTLDVNGVQIAGPTTVRWQHGTGVQEYTYTGDFGEGPHTVSVHFINDLVDSSVPALDRNLYVHEIVFNGQTFSGEFAANDAQDGRADVDVNAAEMYVNGTVTFSTIVPEGEHIVGTDSSETLLGGDGADLIEANGGGGTINGRGGDDTLVGGDGNDTLNGGGGNDVLLGGGGNDTLINSDGNDTMTGGDARDIFQFQNAPGMLGSAVITDFQPGAGGDALKLWDYSFGSDVNQFLSLATDLPDGGTRFDLGNGQTITLEGVSRDQLTTDNLLVGVHNPVPVPISTLVLHVAEDAWNGDAHFVLLVDGEVETPEIRVTWAHSTGTFHDFYVGGMWSDAPHRVEIRFIDDAWGGSRDMDRNLYIGGITYNGQFYAGQLAENTAQNGQPDADPNAAEMYVNGSVIFHHVGAEPAPPPPPPPPPDDSGSSSLSIRVAEDAWNGDAQFIVKVDGTQFGGIQTATASHGAGDWQDIAIDGPLSAGPHTVAIDFLNDAWGGTPDTDRNLYIQSVTLNGETISGATADNNAANGMSTADPSAAVMAINGTSTFHTVGSGGGDTSPTSTIVLHLSEDAWNGDAQFKVLIDGNEIGDIRSVTASHADQAVEDVTITGAFGSSGPSVIDVVFLNDAWGGSADTDRNLYVQSVDVNGVRFDGNTAINDAANGGEGTDLTAAVMDINGTASFHIDHNAPPLIL